MTEKFSKDGVVRFTDEDHVYVNTETGEELQSVTRWINQFKVPFDRLGLSARMSESKGIPQEEILADWDNRRDAACEMGTILHKQFEDYYDEGIFELNELYPKSKQVKNVIDDLFESGRLEIVESELIVYDDKNAGQVDCIAKDKDGNHYILDWKTNKKFDMKGYYHNVLPPYEDYRECHLNTYSIQLEKYASMCKEYDIKGCYIVWIGVRKYKMIKTVGILKS